MRARLIRTTGEFPPGSFTIHDSVTGKNYSDQHTTFDERVKEIVRDRLANRRLFVDARLVDPGYVSDWLSEAICQRLNYNGKFCEGDGVALQTANMPRPMPAVPADKRCVCGSNDLEIATCATCGNKIIGYRCKKCGAEFR